MKERSPAFQWYPKDFLTSSRVALMNLAQQGAYVRLLNYQWLDGSIPEDLGDIARLCGAQEKEMQRLWPALAPCFVPAADLPGRLVNLRLERERAAQREYRKKKSEAGTKGAHSRHKQKDGSATVLPEVCQEQNDGVGGFCSPSATTLPLANDSSASASSSASAKEDLPSPADSGGSPPGSAASAPGSGRPRDVFLDGCWAVYDQFEAPRPNAGLLKNWRKEHFKDNADWMIRGLEHIAKRGGLDKGDAYVRAALAGFASGGGSRVTDRTSGSDAERAGALANIGEDWTPAS